MVLSPAACTKKVDRDGVGDRKKEEKCLGALATAILANDCSDHDQDAKFPAWDDRSRDDNQGGSIQETSDSENSDFEGDSERERLGTEAMRTLLSNIEEFVDSSEAPLKQIQIYSKNETGTTRRILLDNEAMTETPSDAPLKQTPVNHLPLQTKKVMQCEYLNQKKIPPSSSSLAAMDKTFPSAAPIYELPVECLQEHEGIRSSTELRQPTLLSANDAVEANSLELSEMEIRSAPTDKTIQKSEKYELLGNAHCGQVGRSLPTLLSFHLQFSLSPHMHVTMTGCNLCIPVFSCK
ncbi:unnamed protein product [Sphagnum jensenii]|uniref:Uncharacterized protein n=1 Tax=Sphagnum jensenii TaxID=128206 RepID=A0ABP0WWE0_9BRYO